MKNLQDQSNALKDARGEPQASGQALMRLPSLGIGDNSGLSEESLIPISSIDSSDRMSKRELSAWKRASDFGTVKGLEIGSTHPVMSLPSDLWVSQEFGGVQLGTVAEVRRDIFSKRPYLRLALENKTSIWLPADEVRYYSATIEERINFLRACVTHELARVNIGFPIGIEIPAHMRPQVSSSGSHIAIDRERGSLSIPFVLRDLLTNRLAQKLLVANFEIRAQRDDEVPYTILREALSETHFYDKTTISPRFEILRLGTKLRMIFGSEIYHALTEGFLGAHPTSFFYHSSSPRLEQLLDRMLPSIDRTLLRQALIDENVIELDRLFTLAYSEHGAAQPRGRRIFETPASGTWGINAPAFEVITDFGLRFMYQKAWVLTSTLEGILRDIPSARQELEAVVGDSKAGEIRRLLGD
jgi:hypothetical protein